MRAFPLMMALLERACDLSMMLLLAFICLAMEVIMDESQMSLSTDLEDLR